MKNSFLPVCAAFLALENSASFAGKVRFAAVDAETGKPVTVNGVYAVSKLPPAERVALNSGRRPRFKESAPLVPTCFRSGTPREARGLQINQSTGAVCEPYRGRLQDRAMLKPPQTDW
jgi:hypothetical protein